MPITEAYNPETLTMNYPELLKESEKVFESLKVTYNLIVHYVYKNNRLLHSFTCMFIFYRPLQIRLKNWKKKQGNNQVSKLGFFIELDG